MQMRGGRPSTTNDGGNVERSQAPQSSPVKTVTAGSNDLNNSHNEMEDDLPF